MKLKNKLSIITAVSLLAFVGVGFGAWTFTKQVQESSTVSKKVTASIEANGLNVEDGAGHALAGLYLICDAPAGQAGLIPGNGIYWSTQADGSDTITALTLVGSVTEDDNDIADITTYNGHFISTATSAVSGTYINIASTNALDATVVSASKNASVSTTFTLPEVSYASVPTSVAEVDALQTEASAISLTFSFKFNVASIN